MLLFTLGFGQRHISLLKLILRSGRGPTRLLGEIYARLGTRKKDIKYTYANTAVSERHKSDINSSCPSVYSIHLQHVFLGRTSAITLSTYSCLPRSSALQNRESASFESSPPLYCLSAVCSYFKEKDVTINCINISLGNHALFFTVFTI